MNGPKKSIWGFDFIALNNALISIVAIVLLLLLLLNGCIDAEGDDRYPGRPDPVLYFSGGAIDDYVSYILLTTMNEINLKGIVLTNADTLQDPAMELQWKISTFIQDTDRPVALSNARGWNPFPYEYRADCIRFNKIGTLDAYTSNPYWPPYPSGEELIKDILKKAMAANSPITMLVTCPITAISNVLAEEPELEAGIKRIIFMGGAVNVEGNLDSNTIPAEIANSTAEWNVFWDPFAVDWLFKNTSVPITLFPLDVTNQAKVAPLMAPLETQSYAYRYSELVFSGYELTSNQPYYCMWNVLTTCYLVHPEFFSAPVPIHLIIETEGFGQGTVIQDDTGREILLIQNVVNIEGFYNYVLQQLQEN